MSDPILDVRDLRIEIRNQPVVENVTFAIHPGEILSLVGESGCGKSLTAFGIMGLLPEVARIAGGSVKLNGRELAGLREREMLDLRGREMSIIFQEPFASLNPLMPVGRQVAESLIRHRGLSKREAAAEALGRQGVALRAGLHCAPLAHESAGTLETGTVRISFGWDANAQQTRKLLTAVSKQMGQKS